MSVLIISNYDLLCPEKIVENNSWKCANLRIIKNAHFQNNSQKDEIGNRKRSAKRPLNLVLVALIVRKNTLYNLAALSLMRFSDLTVWIPCLAAHSLAPSPTRNPGGTRPRGSNPASSCSYKQEIIRNTGIISQWKYIDHFPVQIHCDTQYY